jgi:glycosidase
MRISTSWSSVWKNAEELSPSALTPPDEFDGDLRIPVSRFLAAHSIILSLQGVPAIYFHSLFGSRNDYAGVERTGAPRSINRQKLDLSSLERELADAGSLRRLVFDGLARLLRLRVGHPAFDPSAGQQVLTLMPGAFCLVRIPVDGERRLLCLHNVTENRLQIDTRLNHMSDHPPVDLLSREPIALADVTLEPYQVRWIEFRAPRGDR